MDVSLGYCWLGGHILRPGTFRSHDEGVTEFGSDLTYNLCKACPVCYKWQHMDRTVETDSYDVR